MKKLLLLIFLLSACSIAPLPDNNAPVIEQTRQEFRVITPESEWGSMYFHKINEEANKYQLPDIRAKSLPDGDLKVRIWTVFGDLGKYLGGFTLDRKGSEWSATYTSRLDGKQKKLPAPKSGWESMWRKLEAAGVLTLPEAEEIKCNNTSFDASSYVVEYNARNVYRTYKYDNPEAEVCPEAKKFMEILKIMKDEFGNP